MPRHPNPAHFVYRRNASAREASWAAERCGPFMPPLAALATAGWVESLPPRSGSATPAEHIAAAPRRVTQSARVAATFTARLPGSHAVCPARRALFCLCVAVTVAVGPVALSATLVLPGRPRGWSHQNPAADHATTTCHPNEVSVDFPWRRGTPSQFRLYFSACASAALVD